MWRNLKDKMVVGKKTLADYEFETIGDYYEYIVESEINGNYSQMKDLYKSFSNNQKKDFLRWLVANEIKNIKVADLI
jgi:hypothetical protein